jgi:hypothetical protein
MLINRRFGDLKVIKNVENAGFCRANNTGAKVASGKYILLLNPDVYVEIDTIHMLYKRIEEIRCFAMYPKLLYWNRPEIINASGAYWSLPGFFNIVGMNETNNGKGELIRCLGSIHAAVMMNRKEFIEIGLYDENFFIYCEDIDVCYRSNILGFDSYVDQNIIAYHEHEGTAFRAGHPIKYQFFYLRNYLLVFLKNYEMKSLIAKLPSWVYQFLCRRQFYALKSFHFKLFWLPLCIVLSVIMHLHSILIERWRIQNRRKRNDAYILSLKSGCPD